MRATTLLHDENDDAHRSLASTLFHSIAPCVLFIHSLNITMTLMCRV